MVSTVVSSAGVKCGKQCNVSIYNVYVEDAVVVNISNKSLHTPFCLFRKPHKQQSHN